MSTNGPEVEVQLPRPRPWWRRVLRRLAWALLLGVIGLGIRLYYQHYQAVRKLEEALAAQDREGPGWRMKDIEAARATVPDAENSALVLARARELLPQPAWNNEVDALLQGPRPCEQLRSDQVALLRRELERARPALEDARKVAELPRGRHPITHLRPAISTQFPHMQPLRFTVVWLKLDAMLRAQDGDLRGAVWSCRAALNAARSVGDEPAAISQLIRVACVAVAGGALERTLAQGEAPEQELATLQQLFAVEDTHPMMQVMLRAERAMIHDSLEAVECGEVTLTQLSTDDPLRAPWNERFFGFFFQDRVREAHPLLFPLMARQLEIASLPLHQQADAQREFLAQFRSLPRNVVTLFFPAVDKLGRAVCRHHAAIRCLAVLLALERYRLRHAAWPESLGQLTPDLLKEVPLDPYDGQPLRYRRLADGVMIYSVSEDGVDDGGNLDREHPNQPGADIGYRLWEVKHRRQPPRPAPPAPEEQPGDR